ncbi:MULTISPECIES: hypothetical protein [unclassified Prochlorococcus]|uniref:hypothetical protein n=1 Tax=unclassified Prochlorococcus TaxID=2627481 RepID=UPI0005339ADF|nr:MULTISPECIES: hypothetical protein [unclassified Prochlorococcus]KGG16725.1 hypothetical protein EV06_0567 [Prochlorococcus sp. MIT 0602]KGG18302.1 hypothetical protein EV07_0218 [Prochlorococcus sp. MIT 0603]
MNSSEALFRATVKRLKARLEKSINYSATETVEFIKDAPDLIKKEWEDIKKEIIAEASLYDELDNEEQSLKEVQIAGKQKPSSSQKSISKIREKIIYLTKNLEELN